MDGTFHEGRGWGQPVEAKGEEKALKKEYRNGPNGRTSNLEYCPQSQNSLHKYY